MSSQLYLLKYFLILSCFLFLTLFSHPFLKPFSLLSFFFYKNLSIFHNFLDILSSFPNLIHFFNLSCIFSFLYTSSSSSPLLSSFLLSFFILKPLLLLFSLGIFFFNFFFLFLIFLANKKSNCETKTMFPVMDTHKGPKNGFTVFVYIFSSRQNRTFISAILIVLSYFFLQ